MPRDTFTWHRARIPKSLRETTWISFNRNIQTIVPRIWPQQFNHKNISIKQQNLLWQLISTSYKPRYVTEHVLQTVRSTSLQLSTRKAQFYNFPHWIAFLRIATEYRCDSRRDFLKSEKYSVRQNKFINVNTQLRSKWADWQHLPRNNVTESSTSFRMLQCFIQRGASRIVNNSPSAV